MNTTALGEIVLGVMVTLLGIVWFVQGLGIVQMSPILCVADCEPLTGRSIEWTVIGAITSIVGIAIGWEGLRRVKR